MIRLLTCAAILVGLFAATAAQAQTRAPASGWTGFYIGAQIGGGWGDQSVSRAANDPAAGILTELYFGGLFVGQQPLPAHGVRTSGVTGGIELGYNWQVAPRWVVGVEADFSGSSIGGSSSATSVLATVLGTPTFFHTVTAEQQIDWWGTARARIGWLATPDLLLFGTAGVAFGKVTNSDRYDTSGPGGAFIGTITTPNGFYSFACTINATCFTGSDSKVKAGWAIGAGGEWRWSERWSLKAEYLYINLGETSVRTTALATSGAGHTLANWTSDFGRTDFHVARLGVNYRF